MAWHGVVADADKAAGPQADRAPTGEPKQVAQGAITRCAVWETDSSATGAGDGSRPAPAAAGAKPSRKRPSPTCLEGKAQRCRADEAPSAGALRTPPPKSVKPFSLWSEEAKEVKQAEGRGAASKAEVPPVPFCLWRKDHKAEKPEPEKPVLPKLTAGQHKALQRLLQLRAGHPERVQRLGDGSVVRHTLLRVGSCNLGPAAVHLLPPIGEVVVGRASGSDLRLWHPYASGKHAVLLTPTLGSVTILDASLNGTHVNDEEMEVLEERELKHHDKIDFGDYDLLYELLPGEVLPAGGQPEDTRDDHESDDQAWGDAWSGR